MIAIKKKSGSIAIRFWYRNRSAILRSKSIPGFNFQIDQRFFDRNRTNDRDQKKNPDRSRSDFGTEIAQRFSDQN
jgi:hypothetical protein